MTDIVTHDLEQIVHPLVELLNRKYPTSANEEFAIPLLGQIGVLDGNPDEISIELPDDLPNHDLAMRAIATLLQNSGSQAKWGASTNADEIDQENPLRFGLVKKVGWAGYFWAGGRYLVVDHLDDELDHEVAAKQVARLVELLDDHDNLIDLGPEERALF